MAPCIEVSEQGWRGRESAHLLFAEPGCMELIVFREELGC